MSVCVCVFSTLGDFFFCKLINEGPWGANRLLQILFQIKKNFYGDFSDAATGLWRDCLSRTQCHEWYRPFKSGRTSCEDDPKCGRPSTSTDDDHVENMLAVIRQNRSLTVREIAEEVGICRISCHLILTEKLKMRPQNLCSVCWCVAPYPWIFDEAWDDCFPPAALLSRFDPCGLFLVPEVDILPKRSPISDGRGARRKFDTEPSHRPAKHVPERVPGMDKTLEAVYQEWRGVILRWQVSLSCK